MEPPDRFIAWTSCSLLHHQHHHLHRHHHHHHMIFCPLHNHHHHHHLNCHSRPNFNFVPLPPQYSKPFGAVPSQNEFNFKADNNPSEDGIQMVQEQEHVGLEEAGEDDDDEPIFVLTDEWREFFAASEAKRKLEKKNAKKKQQK